MAAQVLSGSGNVSYTNSTGQNVRLTINFLEIFNEGETTMSFPGTSIVITRNTTYGKTLSYKAFNTSTINSSMASNSAGINYGLSTINPIPLEIAIATGETFAITHTDSTRIDGYNCIIIPEAG